MSRYVELPDDVYARIEEAASVSGNSVVDIIASHFPGPPAQPAERTPAKPRNMAERLAGRLGTIASGGLDAIAARPGDDFSDYLLEKKRNGTL